MKLSDEQVNLIRLIKRSPDRGEGWRKISDNLAPYFSRVAATRSELYEIKTTDDAFFIRLSERGQIVGDYV